MKTISSAVEDYIKSKPFLISALSQGIINLTSLSRIIKTEIELSLKKDRINKLPHKLDSRNISHKDDIFLDKTWI